VLPPLADDLQLTRPDASMAGLQLRFNLHDFSSNDRYSSSPHAICTASCLHDVLLELMDGQIASWQFRATARYECDLRAPSR